MMNIDFKRRKNKGQRKGIGIDLPLMVLFIFLSAVFVLGILWIAGSSKTIMVTYEGRQDYIQPLIFIFLYDRSCDAFFSSSSPHPNVHYLYDYLDNPDKRNKEALEDCIIYFLEKRVNGDIIFNNDENVKASIQRAVFEVKERVEEDKEKEIIKLGYIHNAYEITPQGVKTNVKYVIGSNRVFKKADDEANSPYGISWSVPLRNSLVKKIGVFSFDISNSLHLPYTDDREKWSKDRRIYTSQMPLRYKGKIYDLSLTVYGEPLHVRDKRR